MSLQPSRSSALSVRARDSRRGNRLWKIAAKGGDVGRGGVVAPRPPPLIPTLMQCKDKEEERESRLDELR
jgi:hypothetical protein